MVLTSKAPSRHRAWLGGGVKLQTFVPGTRKRFAELASCFFKNLNNWLGFPFFSSDSVFHLSVYLWAEGFWFEDLLLFCHSEEGRRSLNWVPVFYLCKMITWPRDQLSRYSDSSYSLPTTTKRQTRADNYSQQEPLKYFRVENYTPSTCWSRRHHVSRDFQNLGQSEPGDTNEQKKRRVAIVHLTYSSDPVYSKIGLQRGYQFALR